ncbi:cytochrome P450, partial [Streptomyces daliensis]|nr:cytochrome P450 [Streptomyces daliensis]
MSAPVTRQPPAGPENIREVPGAWPVLGHIVPMLRRPLEFLPAGARYGDVVKVRFGRLPVYVLTHPDAVREVLVPGDLDYKRGRIFEKLEPGLGRGLATVSGAEHRRLRRLLQPVFTRERLVGYASVMRDAAEGTAASWQDGQTLEADVAMNELALTALTRSLFRFTAGADTSRAIQNGMGCLCHGLLMRTVLPSVWTRVPTPGNVRFDRAMATMHRAVGDLIGTYRDAG